MKRSVQGRSVTWMMLVLQDYIPVVSILCNPGIRGRHWEKMSQIVGYDLTPNFGTSLRKLLQLKLEPFLEEFESISVAASKVGFLKTLSMFQKGVELNVACTYFIFLQEFSLEKAMQTMTQVWDAVSFHHQPHKDTGVSILTALDDIQMMLDDQIVKTQTMMGSPFVKPFQSEMKVK